MTVDLLAIENHIIRRIQETAPDADLSEGSVIRDVLVSPLIAILQPLANEIYRIQKTQSFEGIESLSDQDIDALMANVFTSRRLGSKATGTARVYLASPTQTTIDSGTIFVDSEGRRYLSTSRVAASSTQLLTLNAPAESYFVDVPVVAESPGSAYNIDQNQIAGILSSNPNILSVSNVLAFSGGGDSEDSSLSFTRAADAITKRDLTTENGAETIILEQFPEIRQISIAGFGDTGMERDTLKGGSLVYSGVEFPDSLASEVHVGGKSDIYIQSDLVKESVLIQNPKASGDTAKNEIAFFASEDDPDGVKTDTLYESAECFFTQKPIVSIETVSQIDAFGVETGLELLDGRDYAIFVYEPNLSMSLDDKRSIRFYRGIGRIQSISTLGLPLGLTALDGGKTLVLCNMDSVSINSIKNFGTSGNLYVSEPGALDSEIKKTGSASLAFKGLQSPSAFFDGSFSGSPGKVLDGAEEITVAMWFRPELLGGDAGNSDTGETPRQTLFAFGTYDKNEVLNSVDRHILSVGFKSTGEIFVNLSTEGRDPIMVESAPVIDAGAINRWCFLAVIYRHGVLDVYLQSDDHYWDGDLPSVLKIANSIQIGSHLTEGSENLDIFVGQDNPASATFASGQSVLHAFYGHIDDLLVESKGMTASQILKVFQGSSHASVILEDQTIYAGDGTGALDAGIPGGLSAETLKDVVLQSVTGAARGRDFTVASSEQVNGSDLLLSILSNDEHGSITQLSVGDLMGVAPIYPGKAILTDLAGDVLETDGLVAGEPVPIGTPVLVEYQTNDLVQDIQDFIGDRTRRVLTADLIVKHVHPILVDVSASLRLSETSVLDIAGLTSAVEDFLRGVSPGSTFYVSDLIKTMISNGAQFISMPISVTLLIRHIDGRFETVSVTDSYDIDKTQGLVPRSIVLSEIS